MENRIYIADLNAYNNGYLKGEWIELPTDKEEIEEVIKRHTNNGQTDFAIHDYELPFSIGEYDDPFKINELIELIEEKDLNETIINHLEIFHSVDLLKDDVYDIKQKLSEIYSLNAINDKDFAEEYYIEVHGFEETRDMPYGLYVDWERVYNDLEHSLNISQDDSNNIYYYSFM